MQIKRQHGGNGVLAPREMRDGSRRSIMRRLADRFDALMAAITFAEEDEAETARQMLAASRRGEDPVRP